MTKTSSAPPEKVRSEVILTTTVNV
jgi:hypothetical protein